MREREEWYLYTFQVLLLPDLPMYLLAIWHGSVGVSSDYSFFF